MKLKKEWLKDLFTRLPAAKITQIKEFTPAVWAKANAKVAKIKKCSNYNPCLR